MGRKVGGREEGGKKGGKGGGRWEERREGGREVSSQEKSYTPKWFITQNTRKYFLRFHAVLFASPTG
jgi:hypothetical protein